MKALDMPSGWDPPVHRTVAVSGEGVAGLAAGIEAHGAWLREGGGLSRKAGDRARLRFHQLLAEEASRRARAAAGEPAVEALIQAIAEHRLDPYAAVASLLDGK
jgi:putative protein kinase ArgK-like GTPase of G3E family